MMKWLTAAAIIVIHGLPALARTIYVPGDLATIQSALDSIVERDTIRVAAGEYNELLIAQSVSFTLIGDIDPDSSENSMPLVDGTNIIGVDTPAVLLLPAHARAVIENFRFKNGDRKGIRSMADSVVIRNCVVDSTYDGFRHAQDNANAYVLLDHCEFRAILFRCAVVHRGNELSALHCIFEGREGFISPLVGTNQSFLESCTFTGNPGRYLLNAYGGPHTIVNCTFGPIITADFDHAIALSNGTLTFSNNTITDCLYGSHVIVIQSDVGDSVEICDNTFIRCQSIPGQLGAVGVIDVYTTGVSEHGPLICDNTFTECSGNRYADDISLGPFSPAILSGNHFVGDNLNGVPSIAMSPNFSQPTPAILRDNYFENCGYALSGIGSADARFNYWGSNSGPYHETLNPFGEGDTITGDVPFIPWLIDSTVATNASPPLPENSNLHGYPNPFNSTVTIEYALAREQDVTLEIYDVLGRQVETLLSERQSVGVHSVRWVADSFASGLYFAKLTALAGASQAVKLLLMK